MSRLCLFIFVLLLPSTAMARCAPFNFFDSLKKIPLVVHGRVIDSNEEKLLTAQCNSVPCRHQISVAVIEVLKGKTAETKLQFEYNYVAQRPEIALFSEGKEYVFAISKIRPDGQATLFGTTCGRPGLDYKYLGQVKQALKRP